MEFDVCAGETFEPAIEFNDFDQFMKFGYRGGWLTPLIESIGLQQGRLGEALAAQPSRLPGQDSHNIVIALGRKREGRKAESIRRRCDARGRGQSASRRIVFADERQTRQRAGKSLSVSSPFA